MEYKMKYTYSNDIEANELEFLKERFELVRERVESIPGRCEVEDKFYPYFNQVALYLKMVNDVVMSTIDGSYYNYSVNKKMQINRELFVDIRGKNYEISFLNPEYAVNRLGNDFGQILSAVYAELRACVAYAFEQKLEQVLIREELFLEIYGIFTDSKFEEEKEPNYNFVKDSFCNFAYDYLDCMVKDSIECAFVRTDSIYKSIVMEADLTDFGYLYDYGEYISDIEKNMSIFMASLPEEDIQKMADTYTEGFRKGFIATGKDISIKKTAEVRYFVGFERVVRAAVNNLRAMGLEPIIRCSSPSFMLGRRVYKIGIECSSPNKQFDADHEHDKVFYFDNRFMERKLEAYRDAFEAVKDAAKLYAGPAVIESFGEDAFTPKEKKENTRLDDDTKRRLTEYNQRAGQITNTYIKGEERSFTIISFPTPAIGDDFEEIFKETIKLNTLNYELYRDMQQIIIDELDKAEYVEIKGMDGNKTDLKVMLQDISDPEKETKFENCVADVNIPVGEVFTSPKLEGTEGVLHVKEVYLNGIQFVNLTLVFKDGIIDNISCSNYEDEEANKKFLDTYLLFNHKTLPIGEFAIGTNTVAYEVTKRYGLEAIMPILIAEKTGPHFAVGDTCYSHEEEVKTYNPDGKEIIAKENRYSKLRDTNPKEAYFNCHTDITIPYDELGSLCAVKKDGTKTDIIVQGRFVLDGLDTLNKPLQGDK